MKTKLLSIAFVILTVFSTQSQDTINEPDRPQRSLRPLRSASTPPIFDTLDTRPITFPFWIVREIALDLEEKKQLELEAQLYALEVENYEKLLKSLEQKEQQRQLQLELLENNISLLKSQLQAEKMTYKGADSFKWSLRILAALGAGFLLGRL